MKYKPIFDPLNNDETQAKLAALHASPIRPTQGDDSGAAYVFREEDILAVNLALVTGRPLLLFGPTGCGKSSLARAVAEKLGFNFLSATITSRSTARDLLWKTDIVQRLAEAQQPNLKPKELAKVRDIGNFIAPGVLWWAYNYASARNYREKEQTHPQSFIPGKKVKGKANEVADSTVLLLDEIDKADPDLPNDLLTPLGNMKFVIEETGEEISLKSNEQSLAPLLIITSNQERELPPTFVRRCIIHEMQQIDDLEKLVEIAISHFSEQPSREIIKTIAAKTTELMMQAKKVHRRGPSTAEFLDAIRACAILKIDHPHCNASNPDWVWVTKAVLDKNPKQVALS